MSGFSKSWGCPLKSSTWFSDLPYNHPAIGVPLLMEPPIYWQNIDQNHSIGGRIPDFSMWAFPKKWDTTQPPCFFQPTRPQCLNSVCYLRSSHMFENLELWLWIIIFPGHVAIYPMFVPCQTSNLDKSHEILQNPQGLMLKSSKKSPT